MPKKTQTPARPDAPATPQTPGSEARSESVELKYKFHDATRFQPQIGVVTQEVDDQAVISDPLTDRYFRLNESARSIWKQACAGNEFAGIVEEIAAEFDISEEIAEKACGLALSHFVSTGLIVHSTNK